MGPRRDGPVDPGRPIPPSRSYQIGLGALFFLSGALGLLYEIVWFRRLHLTLGVGIFAVGAVVSAFMLGLALGSRWASSSEWLRRAPLAAYARLEIGMAVYAVAFPSLVQGLEAAYPSLFRALEGHAAALVGPQLVVVGVVVGVNEVAGDEPPAAGIEARTPLFSGVYVPDGRIGFRRRPTCSAPPPARRGRTRRIW